MTGVIHIVDDEESVRSSLAFLLEIVGFSTRTYPSAQTLLARAGELEDGCVVTDLRMPDINGVELLRRLRASGSHIPAIVVSGHGDVQMAIEAIRHGAFDFIEKPFSEATIIASIRRAMDAEAQADAPQQTQRTREIVETLSEREREVLKGMVDGLPNKLIAENLLISAQTVEDHRVALMDRMQARNLPELVRLTLEVEFLHGADGP